MHKLLFSGLFLVLFVPSGLWGQGAKKMLEKADRHFLAMDYPRAIQAYEEILKKFPTEREAISRLAESYRLVNDSQNSEIWYARLVKYRDCPPAHLFYYGQALMKNARYEQAIPWFELYQQAEPEDQRALLMIESCKNSSEFILDTILYSVNPANVNSAASDFGPVFYQDMILFSSARSKQGPRHKWTGQSFLDMYVARYGGSLAPGAVTPFPGRINTSYHEAMATFTQDGKEMFFTRNNYIKGKAGTDKEGVVNLQTFYSVNNNGTWSQEKPFQYNSDQYSVGHPALSFDGQSLYIVSDMPGGEGETDIWVCRKEGEGWSVPKNAGPSVNTRGKEMFPWVAPDGTLFFASNGHMGLGGLDLYQAKPHAGGFARAENLGSPINSPYDDFALALDEKRGQGFFTTNRPGGPGDDDIWAFVKKIPLRGKVIDGETGLPMEGAEVVINFSNKKAIITTGPGGEFNYGLNFNRDFFVEVNKWEYITSRKMISTREKSLTEDMVLNMELLPDPEIRKGKNLVTIETPPVTAPDSGRVIPAPPTDTIPKAMPPDSVFAEADLQASRQAWKEMDTIQVDSLVAGKVFFIIYYDYNKHDIRLDATRELEKVVTFMKAHSQVKVELSSHTDARGNDEYNLRLSQSRAEEAYDYITGHGIPHARLDFVWRGESQITNRCGNGVQCSDEEHQMNRRTEFRITGVAGK